MTLDNIIQEILFFYNEVAVYLLFGFLVAGILHVLFPESVVRRHLGNDSLGSVLKATIFGIPLPLCSCGVIPVATSLKNSGASKGSTISFLIATPQVGADSFLISYSLLGWIFAAFRMAASLITSLVAGLLINIFGEKEDPAASRAEERDTETAAQKLRTVFHYIQFELLGSIANSLVVGILIAGLIAALVPQGFFESYLSDGLLSMLVMMAFGIPMYVCAASSTPVAASLILKGLSPGAALVFLLTGPATNAIAISAVHNMVGKRSTIIYLSSIAGVSLLLGMGLNMAVDSFGFNSVIMTSQHEILPSWLKIGSSILLFLMLLFYYFKTMILDRNMNTDSSDPNSVALKVDGMTCQHCAGTVKKAVESVSGADNAVVDLENKLVRFNLGDQEDQDALAKIKSAIQSSGFSVK